MRRDSIGERVDVWAAEVEARHRSKRRQRMLAAEDALREAERLEPGPERDAALERALRVIQKGVP